jgi:hypothetical protein
MEHIHTKIKISDKVHQRKIPAKYVSFDQVVPEKMLYYTTGL